MGAPTYGGVLGLQNLIDLSLFNQLVAILVLASAIGFITVRYNQPLIIAFIITGLLAGPSALNLVGEADKELIETLAQFGIALLLFMVGLKLDLRLIKQTGLAALLIALFQVFATMSLGMLISLLLGMSMVESLFIGIGLAFSSTIIAVKLLLDKRVIDSLYGRVALGILIVQDLLVILTTVAITVATGASEAQTIDFQDMLGVVLKVILLITSLTLFIRYLAKPLSHMLARNGELMVVFSIALAVSMAMLCEYFHFSRELGGLLAGVALASTPYNNVIVGRLSALRDFLLLFFFAHLGAHMNLSGIEAFILPAIILSLFVLVGKPLLIMAIMRMFHFTKRVGFMTGITLSQISEFSLIIMTMGLGAGLINLETLNLVTLVGLMTMALSTYSILYSESIFAFIENKFPFFEDRKFPAWQEDQFAELPDTHDIVIFGIGKYGSAMARLFDGHGYSVLAIDFSPDTVESAKKKGIKTIYGDASDPDFLQHLSLDQTKVIVFSFHHYIVGPMTTDVRRTLAKLLREQGYKGHIATTSHHAEHDKDLPDHGIDIILSPYEDAAFHGTEQIIGLLSKERRKRL